MTAIVLVGHFQNVFSTAIPAAAMTPALAQPDVNDLNNHELITLAKQAKFPQAKK